ncbi:MAG: hypothetical protein H6733_05165 [Alphaproteobacteria bacterium]|nr:hypothetical protein [Alphaproteobacteria bacterium]
MRLILLPLCSLLGVVLAWISLPAMPEPLDDVAPTVAERAPAPAPPEVTPPATAPAPTPAVLPGRLDVVVDGVHVLVQQPSAPSRGTIVVLHGAGGDGAAWFDRPETSRFTAELLDAGYTVVAPDSPDRTARKWAPGWPDNADVAWLGTALSRLRAEGTLTAGPTYGVGMSNGGGFVVLAGTALHWQGIVVSHSPGMPHVYKLGSAVPPLLHVYSPRDATVDVDRVEVAAMEARHYGVEQQVVSLEPQPVTVGRLERVHGVSAAAGRRLLTAWQQAGVVDAQGFLTEDPRAREEGEDDARERDAGKERDAWERVLVRATPELRPVARDVRDELAATWGGHAFRSDIAPEVLRWFERHR